MTSNRDFLGTGNVHRLLLKLSSWAVLAMLTLGIYSFISTIIIAKGVNMEAVGAIGIVFPLLTLYHGFAQMVSIGAASHISLSLGKHDDEQASLTAGNAYLLTIIMSLGLIILTALFSKTLLQISGANRELMPLALQYLKILKWGVPFHAIVLLSSAVFRAEGNLKLSTLVIIMEAVLNLMFDFLLIYQLKLGIRSVAFAAILASFLTAIYALAQIWRQKNALRLVKRHFKLHFKTSRSILSIGFSAFSRNAATTAFSLVANNTLKTFGGSTALMAFGAVNRVVVFFFLPIMGINQGLQPIASYNYGAKKLIRVKQVVKFALLYATVIGTLATLVGLIFSPTIIRLFTRNPDIFNEATLILRFQLLFFWTFGPQTVAATLYQAIGKAWPSLVLSTFKQLLLLIPLVILLPRLGVLEAFGIWLAYPISDFLALIIVCLALKRQLAIFQSTDTVQNGNNGHANITKNRRPHCCDPKETESH